METILRGLQRRYRFFPVTSGADLLTALENWILCANDYRVEAAVTDRYKQKVEDFEEALRKAKENCSLVEDKLTRAEAT